jgi:hypothetical protein
MGRKRFKKVEGRCGYEDALAFPARFHKTAEDKFSRELLLGEFSRRLAFAWRRSVFEPVR